MRKKEKKNNRFEWKTALLFYPFIFLLFIAQWDCLQQATSTCSFIHYIFLAPCKSCIPTSLCIFSSLAHFILSLVIEAASGKKNGERKLTISVDVSDYFLQWSLSTTVQGEF